MNPLPLDLADDADLRLSLPAMQRAARRAREIARQTNTCLVVGDQGRVVRIRPDELDRIGKAWMDEAQRRARAYQAGEVTAHSLDDVFRDEPDIHE